MLARSFSRRSSTCEQVEDFERRGDDGWGDRVGEEIGARTLAQELDDLFAAAGVAAAGAAEGFAERAGDDVDAALDACSVRGCRGRSRR